MSEKNVCAGEERLIALSALAAGKAEAEEACLSYSVLSSFIDKRLPARQRGAVVRHLNRCEQCYREWLDVTTALETAGEKTTEAAHTDRLPWWHAWLRPSSMMIPLGAAVMTVAVVLLLPVRPGGDDAGLPRLAAIVAEYSKARDLGGERLPVSPGTVLGFNPVPAAPARVAFTRGARDAAAIAGGENGKFTSDDGDGNGLAGFPDGWRDYYRLGQWAQLAWTLTQFAGVAAKDWRTFDRQCVVLIERFERRRDDPGAARVAAWLAEMHGFLQKLGRHSDPALRTRLARRLELFILRWTV